MRTETIFDGNSVSMIGIPFCLSPGVSAVIRGFNFPQGNVEVASDSMLFQAAACLYMVKLEPFKGRLPAGQPHEGWWAIPASTRVMIESPVIVENCAWQINGCQNQKVLDIPGYYRFVLNHDSLVGSVHLYADVYSHISFKGSGAAATFFGGAE